MQPLHFFYIDTHTHVHFDAYDGDRDKVVRRALDSGVHFITVGVNRQTSEQAIELAEQYPHGVYAAVGLHPNEVGNERFDAHIYKALARHPKVVALGETGLDFYRLPSNTEDSNHRSQLLDRQREAFQGFMQLSEELRLPLICHVRDNTAGDSAHTEVIQRIRDYNQQSTGFDLRGVIHCFSGTEIQAKQYVEMGFKLGINGMVTFAHLVGTVVKAMPLKHLLLETDCPYLSPEPMRGQRNEPSFVRYVAKEIARIKQVALPEVTRTTALNSALVFHKIEIEDQLSHPRRF